MGKDVTLRSYLGAFAQVMEKKLREHDDRGDGNHIPGYGFWQDRLHQEVDELIIAMDQADSRPQCRPIDMRRVAQEAADVANIAMFIAKWYGGLPTKLTKPSRS